VVQFSINKDGSFGRRGQSDICDEDEFRTLIDFVERKIADLAGRIVAGEVAVRPYLAGNISACARCDYRSICRFEPGVNRYRILDPLSREEAIAKMGAAVRGEEGAGHGG
jgi:ATP-dependent helicase/nuclease subunit B